MTITEMPHAAHKQGDHDDTDAPWARPALATTQAGHDVGLISEAGMPAIADRGSSVLRTAHRMGVQALPLVGPVSILLALAASGLNGQNFAFVAYPPTVSAARQKRIRHLQGLARKTGQGQLFIETPWRNAALLDALVDTLDGGTRLMLASALTLTPQRTHNAAVRDWKKNTAERMRWRENRLPSVFDIGH